MPNGVKYSTTTPTGSLRRGNVALGVNGNLGPTANTGFYSMPTPQSGKYIINKVSPSGIPNFFAPQNDTELIRLARNEGATGADTGSAAAVLAWIGTQTNLMAANFEYENIVTDGLVLNLDAGFVGSYPTTASTWYDLSGNTNNGTLINGPTFNSANSGSIVFDGSNDYASGSGTILTTQGTLVVWFKTSNTYSNNYLLSLPWFSHGNNGFDLGFGGSTTFRGIVVTTDGHRELTYTTTYSDNNWHMGAITYSASNAVLYYDGVARTTWTSLSGSLRQTANGEFNIARFGSFGAYVAASISNTAIYNRALSNSEITQNFNAQKDRFGL